MATNPLLEILKLSVAERIQLVEDIWDSIARESELLPLTDAQRAELDRRLESNESDPGATRSWAEVRDRVVREE
jgi:putative addiction module component (TIGR02574 family)